MIDVYISFENADQIRRFRKKIIRDFRCPVARCGSCKEVDVCDIIARFYVALGDAEFNARKGEP